MKISVPFFLQTTPLNCGPANLKMVLDYFGFSYSINELEEMVKIKEGKGVSSLSLAIVLKKLGLDVEFFSKHLGFNSENLKLDFYKKYSNNNLSESENRVKEARKLGVELFEQSISLNEILNKLSKDSLIITLIDWNKVVGREGYLGHFVLIVGYDKNNVIIHNSGINSGKAFMKIKKDIFDKARVANGTDEDLIIVKRKFKNIG